MSINYIENAMIETMRIETMHIDSNAKAPYPIRKFRELKKLYKRVTP